MKMLQGIVSKASIILEVSILVFCAGCALADLRPAPIRNGEISPASQKQARQILEESANKRGIIPHWRQFKAWDIEAADIWQANVFRHLTPIKQPKQKFQMTIGLADDTTQMTFLDGKFAGNSIGIDQQGSYRIEKGKRTDRNFKDILLYLPHVRGYFLWPQVVWAYPLQAYAGEKKMGDRIYDRIFVTRGDLEPHAEDDQYVIWINRQTDRIDYIEFTLRSILKSYHGAIAYRDYRQVQGMELPFEVILLDKVSSAKYSHKLVAEKMSLN